MRAKEFIVNVNVPIRIKLAGNGQPDIDMPGYQSKAAPRSVDMPKPEPEIKDPQELETNPVFIPPLQQQIEIQKALAGKQSPVIQDLLQHDDEPEEGANSYEDSDEYNEALRRQQR